MLEILYLHNNNVLHTLSFLTKLCANIEVKYGFCSVGFAVET